MKLKSSYIAVSYQCNHHCLMCPLSKSDYDMVPITMQQVLQQLASEQLQSGDHVTLSGGEPTLVPFLPELLAALMEMGLRVTLLTNASGFASQKLVKQVVQAVDKCRFNVVTALHAADSSQHDAITRKEGSLQESLAGLRNLLQYQLNVTIKHILTAASIVNLPTLATMIRREFPPCVEIQFTSTDYSGRATEHCNLFLARFSETQNVLERAIDILTVECKQAYPISIIEMPLCACSPKYWKYFRSTGCHTSVYISPNTKTESKTLHNLPNGCMSNYPECQECDVQCFCPGAWHSAYEFLGTGLLRPIHCSESK